MRWTRGRLRFVESLWVLLLALVVVAFMFATGRTLVGVLFAVPLAAAAAWRARLFWEATQLDEDREDLIRRRQRSS